MAAKSVAEAVEALTKDALAGVLLVVSVVVVAEGLAAKGDSPAAFAGGGQDEGALTGWVGCGHVLDSLKNNSKNKRTALWRSFCFYWLYPYFTKSEKLICTLRRLNF